jgi:hypothetical protein
MTTGTDQKPATATKTAPAKKTAETAKKKAEPKPFVPLNFDAIAVTAVTSADTMRDHRRSRGERDEDQQAIDTLVRKAHQRWMEAGRPEEWVKQTTGYTLRVPNHVVDTVERRIRRAGQYFDLAIRFGKPVDLGNGHTQLLFIAKDRTEKDDAEDAAEKKDENAADNGAA